MDHQALVRVLHRFAHQAEQPQPFHQAEPSLRAVARDRQPVDIFEYEERQPVVSRAAIDQPRDKRMFEIR